MCIRDRFEILSASPRVYYFPRFLSDDEIDALFEHTRENADDFERSHKWAVRSRQAAFIPFDKVHGDARLRSIVRRMSAETKLPLRHFHWLKMMRYDAPERESDALTGAQYYSPHVDLDKRYATFIVYLTTVPEGGGGETMFIDVPARDADGARRPAAGREGDDEGAARPPPLYAQFGDDVQASKDHWEGVTRGHAETLAELRAACEGSAGGARLKVRPVRGAALLFYSYHANGTVDRGSAHTSCPITSGTKWIAQQWILDRPLEEAPTCLLYTSPSPRDGLLSRMPSSA